MRSVYYFYSEPGRLTLQQIRSWIQVPFTVYIMISLHISTRRFCSRDKFFEIVEENEEDDRNAAEALGEN